MKLRPSSTTPVTASKPALMPDARPSRIALPESTSHCPAPEKKPTILSLIPVTVLTTASIPADAALLMPFQMLENRDLTLFHALLQMLWMIPSAPEMTLLTPFTAVDTRLLMPFQMLDATCFTPFHTADQSPEMAPVTAVMIPWMTPRTVWMTVLMAFHTVVTTLWMTGHTAFQMA